MAINAINWPIKAINNRSKNPELMKNQEFGVWDNEIWILLDQNEAEKSSKPLKILFKYDFTIK